VRPWRMLGTIRGPRKRGSVIATSSMRRIGSRTSGARDRGRSLRPIEAVKRDGSFEFHERYLRRSIYGFKKKQLQLAASSARGIEFMQKQVSVKLPQGSQMATLTLGIEATLRNVG
jgi:hypothetical protein